MPREIEDGARKYGDNNIRYTELIASCKMGAGDLQQIGRYYIYLIQLNWMIQLNMRCKIYKIHKYNIYK